MKHILPILLVALLLCACTPAANSDTAPHTATSIQPAPRENSAPPAFDSAPQPTETEPVVQITTAPTILETVPPTQLPPETDEASTVPPTEIPTESTADTQPDTRPEELPIG